MKITGITNSKGWVFDFDITQDVIKVVCQEGDNREVSRTFERIHPPASNPTAAEFYNFAFANRVANELDVFLGVSETHNGLLLSTALDVLTIEKECYARAV